MAKVAIYDWLNDGRSVGLGTQCELNHWTAEGVFAPDEITLGAVLGYESAAADDARKAAWARAE